MADNIDITPGSGKTVATDDCGAAGHAQVVKLAVSTDGSATLIPADANGVTVAGGTAHDGVDAGNPVKVGGKALTSIPTPVADADRVNGWFDEYGRLVTVEKDTELGTTPGITGLRDQVVAQRYTSRADSLADGIDGSWTQTTAGGGTVASTTGEGQLKTSTGTTGSAQISSPTVPYYPGRVAWLNSAVRFGDTGTAGNIRRLGMFTVSGTTPQDGFYFELSGTTLNAVVVKATSATAVASTSWSRFSTAPFTLDTNYHSLEIRYTANSVWFYVDNVLRHAVSGTTSALTTTLTLPITITNVKTSGATDITFAIRNIGNGGFGEPGGAIFETGVSAIGAEAVGGATPHDSVDSGNPLKVGGYAKTTAPTSVADGDRVNAWFTQSGALNIADGAGSITVDNAGTFAVQATVASGATSIAKAEDVASADADVGVPSMAVRKATPANTSGTDGDYEMLQMSAGRLWTSAVIDTALPAGTNAIGKLAANSGVDIGALTANQTVNVAQINGVTTTMGNGASGTGVQRVTLANDSTGIIASIGTSVTPGTAAANLGKAEDAVHASGDTGIMALGVALSDANALTLQASATGDYSILSQDARGVLQVVARPQATRISTTSAGLTTATTAYAVGDQTGTILTISGAAKVSGGTGIIQSITLLDEGDVGASYRLHFYNQSVTLASDNAAFAVSDADQRNYVGSILMPDLADVGANRTATLTNVGLGYLCSGSTSLFCAIETRTANAVYAAVGDLKLILHVYQD